MSRIDSALKQGAHEFLSSLQHELNQKLPDAPTMRQNVQRIVAESKADDSKKHSRTPECVFLNHYAIPIISKAMQRINGIGANEAREALLCEFWNSGDMQNYCLQSAGRTTQSPFMKKYLEKSASEIMNAWTKGDIDRASPDFAFGNPFPYRIVFEGKYFVGGSSQQATTDLVTNIREAFFYRCFPYAPQRTKKPNWDYDFSCAIAYDASEEGFLQSSWNAIHDRVKASFWEGANLYVMIIRGQSLLVSST